MKFEMIVSVSKNRVIGTPDRPIPWVQYQDRIRFRDKTLDHLVVYGKETLKSLGFKNGHLNRGNLILTNSSYPELGLMTFAGDLGSDAFIEACSTAILKQPYVKQISGEATVYIVGGADVYRQALDAGIVSKIHLTRVYVDIDDANATLMPEIPPEFEVVATEYHLGDGDINENDFAYITLAK